MERLYYNASLEKAGENNMVLEKDIYSTEYKVKVVLELMKGERSIQEIADEYKVQSEMILQWKEKFIEVSTLFLNPSIEEEMQEKLEFFLNEQELEENENFYIRELIENTENLVNVCDLDKYEVLYINKACRDACGVKNKKDYINKKCYELFYGKTSPCSFCTTDELLLHGVHQWKIYNPMHDKHYALTDRLTNINGKKIRMEVCVDISESEVQMKELDNKLYLDSTLFACIRTLTETAELQHAIEKMLEIVCKFHNGNRGYIFECTDDNLLLNNTYEWCEEGVSAEIDNLQNVPFDAAKDWFLNFEKFGNFFISNLDENLDKNSPDYRILEAQGIKSLMAAPLVENGQMKGFIGVDDPRCEISNFSLLTSVTYFVINDIQKRRMIVELEELSYVDVLTQLHNRNKYVKDLEYLEKNRPNSLGVVYIDLNGLKVANDQFGHDYGDYLLKQLASILTTVFDKNIYRIGGDEFVVFCPNMDRHVFENYVARLRKEVNSGKDITASFGATWEEKILNIGDLVKHTDDLMYAEKQQYYKNNSMLDYNHSSSVAKHVIDDLNEGRYEVLLQPKIKLDDNSICGAEALVRGRDKNGKLIFPESFIPMREADGTICHIDFFVLETVCRFISKLNAQGEKIENVSVNFSRITLLEYDVVNHMSSICKKYNVKPSQLTIEVTESNPKLKNEELASLVYKIKQLGFYISLDDYGTKYANITTLSNICFDEIKLDKTIVNELLINKKARTMVKHTIEMLKELKMCKIVAEGIENLEELNLLRQYGCEYGQGYYFSRPIPIEEFIDRYFD